MLTAARKLYLIEQVLKVKNGILSKREAADMKAAIAKSCETIDENDWK